MTDCSDFVAQLAALREQYVKQLAFTLDDLVSRVSGQGTDIAPEILTELHDKLHKLAGSGGSFGFPELSRQARKLELAARPWCDGLSVPEPAQWQAWKNDLELLRQTLADQAMSGVMTDNADAVRAANQENHIRIVLIEDDELLGAELSKGLSQFGYKISHCPVFADAEAVIMADPPDMMIVDSMLSAQTPDDGVKAVNRLFAKLGYSLPTIFITARLDFSARLAAAKAEGSAFLTKPIDIPVLAGSIEKLQQELEITPYRVLIVDDDEVLAEHYRLILASAGMLVKTVSQPKDVLETMQNLNPDILIVDLYMPECTGAQLARAIRYDDKWLSIPIIYLSAENDLDEQIRALESGGGDDFLIKPISDRKLVATVKTRAARARKVDELMSKDSLTGLLKHSNIKDRLAQEVERAHRQGKVMAMAMVDMDHFKRVNDTWGHPMGDQVIKTLAHLLRQRLRRQDSIGRYGGEEFAVVLPECSAEDATHLLNDIRQRFSEIQFIHQGQSFTITLSAGVAGSDQCSDAQSLLAAADAALYAAKDSGRNQVCRFEDVAGLSSQ